LSYQSERKQIADRDQEKRNMKKIALTVMLLLLALSFTLAQRSKQAESVDVLVRHTASQPINDPVAVDGTDLRHNEATVKAGYEFINRGQSVDVVKIRTNKIMGTYVCPCKKTDGGTCELVFTPSYLTCKGGSCTGATCLLTARPLVMRQ
jgi:hypothetical protein